ncbi:hypothetical protein UFOVP273_49 [uncultured Caudovirales phage]|uniref:Uncharacterized protein n=1 Tax=uncultured Caudovirales phage TaxID=2100421 RepID=A0A6J5LRP5_9CAUD|nr:hypothetical protein UFOVP273_49 [uncultured Caudovirales phage]
MAKSKRSGAGHKTRYTAYKNEKREDKNRRTKLQRALKKNPQNAQIETALADTSGHRRGTPKTVVWSSSKRKVAQLFKLFTGKFNADIFHNNEKISAPALMTPGPKSAHIPDIPKFEEMGLLSLRVRMV